MKPITQTFNDGVLFVYEVTNIAEDGDMPKDGIALKFNTPLPYEERTVGMGRFWTAKQLHTTVERLLRIPCLNGVSLNDIVIPIDGKQYHIAQVQKINDIEPRCLDLSLERVDADYDIKGY